MNNDSSIEVEEENGPTNTANDDDSSSSLSLAIGKSPAKKTTALPTGSLFGARPQENNKDAHAEVEVDIGG